MEKENIYLVRGEDDEIMSKDPRIQKKIFAYSYVCKCLGVINEEQYNQITGKAEKKSNQS